MRWVSDQFLRKDQNTINITLSSDYVYNQPIDLSRFSTLDKLIGVFRRVISIWFLNTRKKRLQILRENNNVKFHVEKSITKIMWKQNEITCDKLGREIEFDLEDPTYKRQDILSYLIKRVQEDCFANEIRTITQGKQLPYKHLLGKLLLSMQEGLLCSSSRIPNAILKNPRFKGFNKNTIVLPRNHHLTKLIILQAHVQNNHFHFDTTVATLTKEYFIPHVHTLVKQTIRENCFICRALNRKPHAPLMGDLPIEKLCVEHCTFTNIMIDMAGPFLIKSGKTRNSTLQKRYFLVVVCLTTRAMHIEIMHEASSDSCVKALICTFETRGYPRKIMCDRGTNFIGADNALRKIMIEHNQKLAKDGRIPHKFIFEFAFNPARSPHMQGSVERLIGNIKIAMNKMKKTITGLSENLDDPSFRMLAMSIMGMMNNRPLCTVQIKGTNSYLTPNSFIMGRDNNSFCPNINPPTQYDELWLNCLAIRNTLWEHFVDHCVPQWITREKWLRPTKNFIVGEIVLTVDYSNVNEWRLARIIEIHTGSANQVRKLTLMLGKRHLNDVPKFKGSNFVAFAKNFYDKGKCFKVTRSAAHVIKLDLFSVDALSIPNASNLDEITED